MSINEVPPIITAIESLYQPQLNNKGNLFLPGEHDISNEVYHASIGVSRSGITELKKSPLHYWENYINPEREKKPTTSQMIFGDAVHTMIMERELFDERFIVSQKLDGRTKEGKKAKEDLEIIANGRHILYEDDFNRLSEIMKEVDKHPLIPKLIKDAKIERSLFWIDSETELLCKARPDIWTPKYLVDVKTTADSTYNAFCWSVRDYNYHIQAAMQIDAIRELTGVLMHNFIFITIQTSKPYRPYIYTLGDLEIEHGRKEYKKLLRVLRACFDTNHWCSDRENAIEINLPPFFFNEQVINNLMEIYECQT